MRITKKNSAWTKGNDRLELTDLIKFEQSRNLGTNIESAEHSQAQSA